MPTFVTMGRFSHAAIQGLMAKPEDRTATIQKLMAAMGGKLIGYYLTTGDTDFVIISEAPDAESAVAAVMTAAGTGAVSDIKTSQAWTSGEFAKIAERAGAAAKSYRAPGA